MINDESPADSATIGAIAAGDNATNAEPSGAKPKVNRKPAASPRSRKPAAKTTSVVPSETAPVDAPPEANLAKHVEVVPIVSVKAPRPRASRPSMRRPKAVESAEVSPLAVDHSTPTVPLPASTAVPLEVMTVIDGPTISPVETKPPAKARRPAAPRKSRNPSSDEVTSNTTEAPETVAITTSDVPNIGTDPEPASDDVTPTRSRSVRSRSRSRGRRRSTELPNSGEMADAGSQVSEPDALNVEVSADPIPASAQPDIIAGQSDRSSRNRRSRSTRKPVARDSAARGTITAVEVPKRGAHIINRNGCIDLVINGKSVTPVFFFGNLEGASELRKVSDEVKKAAASGIHIHSTLVELECPLPPNDKVYEKLDTRLQALIDADKEGFVIPRIVFVPAPGWRKQYPNEVNHYSDGTSDDPSIASDLFWHEAEMALRAVIDHVSKMSYGQRVVGIHLERGEWFHPKDGGYDRSYANREAFRLWLREKYRNSEAALRAAWYDAGIQFYTTEIPPLPTPQAGDSVFLEPRKQRRWIDFLEFTSEITANRLIKLSNVIKEASDGNLLVSICYGYTLEFGHTFSGHLALEKLISSPAIDILAGPPSYRDRSAGKAGSFPAPVHSMALHGKLWVSEDDTKTHLAPGNDSPDDFNIRMENKQATEHVHLRAIGRSLCTQTGINFMDTWGEGWLETADIWDPIAQFESRYRDLLKSRKPVSPEVVVMVDERSLLHVQIGEAFVKRVLQDQLEGFARSGASIGFYLQSDLTLDSFPTAAKLYIFLTPYRITPDQRSAIREKLQSGGKIIVWMFAPGVCDSRGEPLESANDLVGMPLRQQSWNAEIGTRITNVSSPITDAVVGKSFGQRERLNPSYFVGEVTPEMSVLGEYAQSGLPSFVVRKLTGWNSIFIGEPALSPEVIRGLCRFAGAQLYSSGQDDYVYASNGWVTFHSLRDGTRTLYVPKGSSVYDVTEKKSAGSGISEYKFIAKAKTTHIFYVGTEDQLKQLGMEVGLAADRPRRGRNAISTVIEEPVEREVIFDTEADDVIDLAEIGTDDLTDTKDEIAGDGDSEESAAAAAERRRRRRRRGGRGRGRRIPGSPNEDGGEPGPPPTGD